MDDEIESEKTKRNLKIETKEGLKISYEKEVIKKNFPHLIEEISGNKKSLKIDSITTYKNENNKEKVQFPRFSPNTLFNPEPIDFIRRCKTVEDAMSILTFLLKRKEISSEDYNSLRSQIKTDIGLKKLIEKFGGFKNPGYYERKFRNDRRKKEM